MGKHLNLSQRIIIESNLNENNSGLFIIVLYILLAIILSSFIFY